MLSVEKQGTNRILVAAEKAIFYTDNEGETWQTAQGLNTLNSWGNIRKMIKLNDHNQTIYALVYHYSGADPVLSIYQSTDHGNSFSLTKKLTNNVNFQPQRGDIWAPQTNDSLGYVLFGGQVSSLPPGGGQPTFLSDLNVNTSNQFLSGSASSGQVKLYTLMGTILYSSDNLTTWVNNGAVPESLFRNTSFNVSIKNDQIVYIGGIEAHATTNGGYSWSKKSNWGDYYQNVSNKLHADIPFIYPYLDEQGTEKLLIGTDGGLYVSINHINVVENLSLSGLNVSELYSIYSNRNDPRLIYAGSQDQGFQRGKITNTADTIIEFEQTISGDYAHLVSGDNGKSLWFLYPGFVAFNQNIEFNIWDASTNFDGRNDFWLPPLREDPSNKNKAYMLGKVVGTNTPAVYQLNYQNSDITYNQLPFNFSSLGPNLGRLSALTYSPINNKHWYILTENGSFLYSSDNMTSFTKQPISNGPGAHYFYGATVYASKENLGTVYIGGSGFSNPGAFVTHDHGQNFTEITDGLPNTVIFQLAGGKNDSIIYAATEDGPFAFVVKEQKWYRIAGETAPDVTYWSVESLESENLVRWGTHGRGIWDMALIQDTSTTDTTINTGLDNLNFTESVRLYPNPVNEVLNIQVDKLDKTGNILVKVYNINGSMVYQQQHNTTDKTIQIDANTWSKGTYLIDLTYQNQDIRKKFIKE